MAGGNRSQEIVLQTGKRKRTIVLGIIIFMFILSAIIVCVANKKSKYVPPEYDINAIEGEAVPDESYMFKAINTDFGFSYKMAMNTYMQEDGSLYIYFTNCDSNKVNLMIEVVENATDKSLYKSGVVKPGYYVEKLYPQIEIENKATEILVKVYAFDDEWYSQGTSRIGLTLQPW